MGVSNAMELILTAKNINAQQAKEIGLVSHVYPPEELMDKAMELAQAIAANAQVAVRQSKAAIRRGQQTDMYTGAAYEAEAFRGVLRHRGPEGRHDRLCEQGEGHLFQKQISLMSQAALPGGLGFFIPIHKALCG